MARKIIILDRTDMPSDQNYRVAYWLDVPVVRQSFYADPAAKSAVVGASVPEVAALTAGQVVEVVETIKRTTGATLAALRTAMVARLAALQADLTARNPYDRYGTSYDGTTWTAGGVA